MEFAQSVLLILFLVGICEGQIEISLRPKFFVASEGSTGVNYACSTAGSDRIPTVIVILVDGTQPTSDMIEMRGIDVVVINSTDRRLTLQPTAINNNTELICQAIFGLDVITSAPSTFYVQGILSPPSQLQIETRSRDSSQRLSWMPPFTLDITMVDPDIMGYRVCFSFSQEPQVCSVTQDTFFDFLNVDFPLMFLVSAINEAGESTTASFTRPACSQILSSGLGVIVDGGQVQVIVTSAPSNTYSLTVRIQQPPEVVCYDAYRLDVNVAGSENTVLSAGPFLPTLVDLSVQLLQLEEVQGLQANTPYSLQITAVNTRGQRVFNDRIIFSTYDVQTVTLTPQGGGLRIACTFVEGSLATGCDLTLCRREEGGGAADSMCMEVSLQRTTPSTILEEVNRVGTYVITQVVEVESDGSRMVIDIDHVQGSLEASLTSFIATTIGTGDVGGLSTDATSSVGTVAGSVIAVLAVVLLGLIIAIVFIYLWKRKSKSGKAKINGSWTNVSNVAGQREVASWSDSINKETDESIQGRSVVMVTKVNMNPDSVDKSPHHRPTSPFYTDVMHESEACPPRDTSPPPPYLPPKKGSKHSSVISTQSEPSSSIILPPAEFGGPLQNLSQEEIHEIHLTSPSHERAKEWLGVKPNSQMSQESLISQGSQFSVSGANLTYAEIEHHHKNRKQKANPRDKSNVLYSEIKVDQIPPVLPQKKSVKGRPTGSNASSSMSVDIDSTHSGLGYRV